MLRCSGNCYDAAQYAGYSLYCPYAYRLPNGTILAKDLAAEYNYLGNSSIWFYNARTKAQEIIDNNAPIYRGESSYSIVSGLESVIIMDMVFIFFLLLSIGKYSCSPHSHKWLTLCFHNVQIFCYYQLKLSDKIFVKSCNDELKNRGRKKSHDTDKFWFGMGLLNWTGHLFCFLNLMVR